MTTTAHVRRKTRQEVLGIIRETVYDFVHRPNLPEVRAAWERIGDYLLRHIKSQYMVKARGLKDDAGISWPPTKKFIKTGKRMMYDTGNLFRSISAKVDGGKIVVFINPDSPAIEYAGRVLKKRPAWPHPRNMPMSWWNVVREAAAIELRDLIAARVVR